MFLLTEFEWILLRPFRLAIFSIMFVDKERRLKLKFDVTTYKEKNDQNMLAAYLLFWREKSQHILVSYSQATKVDKEASIFSIGGNTPLSRTSLLSEDFAWFFSSLKNGFRQFSKQSLVKRTKNMSQKSGESIFLNRSARIYRLWIGKSGKLFKLLEY